LRDTTAVDFAVANEKTVNPLIQRNIRRLLRVRRREDRKLGLADRAAEAITRFTGSMWFVGLHVLYFGGWLLANSGWLPVRAWDPYPFVMLAMLASVEAIFLSTFVLISQNRQAAIADRRAELALQVGLLTEHEVTRALQMLHKLIDHHGIASEWCDLEELKEEIAPEKVLVEIEREAENESS
jgi:uncharacterized membrane protein